MNYCILSFDSFDAATTLKLGYFLAMFAIWGTSALHGAQNVPKLTNNVGEESDMDFGLTKYVRFRRKVSLGYTIDSC